MNRNLWRQSFANELDKQERRQASNIRRYLSSSYNTAIDQAVESGGIQPLDSLFEIHEIRNLYIDLYRTVGVNFAKWYETAYEKLIKKSTGNTTTWATAFADVGEREAGRKVKIVQGTAKDNLQKVLGQLFKDEEFQNQGKIVQSRILKNRFNEISSYQAERIARTETTNAANQGVLRGATDLFGENALQKEWIAYNDPRTRDSHSSIDGTIVDYNEPFKVPSGFGIDLMNHPADPAGSAANVINCRCSIAVIPKEDAEIREGVELEGFGGALSARTTQLIGDELVSAAKPAQDVRQKIVNDLPEVANVKEAKEVAKKIFSDSGIDIGAVTISKNLDLSTLNQYLNQLNKLTKKYKISSAANINDEVKLIFKSSQRMYGFVERSKKGLERDWNLRRINFGDRTDAADTVKREVFDDKFQRLFKSPIDIDNNKIGTLTHEFAHIIAHSENKIDSEFFDKLRVIFNDYKENRSKYANNKNFKAFNEMNLGSYAITNIDEFLAEGFKEYELFSNPSKYARLIGDLVNKYYKL